MLNSFTGHTADTSGGFQTSSTTVIVNRNEGFQGPSSKHIVRDVISALNASDEAQVELMGNIISSIGHDDYIFRDSTGDVTMEIDDNLWRGKVVTPETKVLIRGEVDKDWSEVTVDADSLQVIYSNEKLVK